MISLPRKRASPVIIIRLIRQWSVPEAENHLDRSRTLKKFDFENPSSSLSQNDKNDLGSTNFEKIDLENARSNLNLIFNQLHHRQEIRGIKIINTFKTSFYKIFDTCKVSKLVLLTGSSFYCSFFYCSF